MYYENIFFIIIIGKEKEGPIRFKIGFASSSCERKREKKSIHSTNFFTSSF